MASTQWTPVQLHLVCSWNFRKRGLYVLQEEVSQQCVDWKVIQFEFGNHWARKWSTPGPSRMTDVSGSCDCGVCLNGLCPEYLHWDLTISFDFVVVSTSALWSLWSWAAEVRTDWAFCAHWASERVVGLFRVYWDCCCSLQPVGRSSTEQAQGRSWAPSRLFQHSFMPLWPCLRQSSHSSLSPRMSGAHPPAVKGLDPLLGPVTSDIAAIMR